MIVEAVCSAYLGVLQLEMRLFVPHKATVPQPLKAVCFVSAPQPAKAVA